MNRRGGSLNGWQNTRHVVSHTIYEGKFVDGLNIYIFF